MVMQVSNRIRPTGTRTVIVTALVVALALPAGTSAAAQPSSASISPVLSEAALAAGGAAGHEYATDVFADPWDYSNGDDLLLDGGPAMNATNPQVGNGTASMHFTDNGYISPIWGGYGGPLFTGRDGGKPGQELNTDKYHSVSFQAYSNRDVGAGLFWFNCPRAVVGSDCGGGIPIGLKAGWHTYTFTPGASAFGGWPVAWGGTVTGLRLAVSPGGAGSDFVLDWFRAYQPNSGAAYTYTNSGGGTGEIVWDADSDTNNNTDSQSNWGVLATVNNASGTVDLSGLPAGNYRVGVRRSGVVSSWNQVTLSSPLPRFITPNAVGDKDYASTVLKNPWDMNAGDDIAAIGNATNVSYSGGQLAATNTSNDPYAALRLGAGGIDSRIYHNVSITSDYDGSFDLRDAPGGGTMGRVVWSRGDGQGGQTSPVLTYAGPRTVTFDLGLPDNQILEPDNPGASFVSNNPITALRWDPNEDPGVRRWYLKDVQLRSDFATTGTFPIVWQDASGEPGGSASLIADTDRTGCDGRTIASGLPVNAGANTTNWNTAGVPNGRYWLCLTITRGNAVTSGYAGGVLVVGANPPTGPQPDPNPVSSWDAGSLSGRTYQVGGWAFDPNAPQQSVNVDMYDTRPDGSQQGVRLSTGGSRPDVASAYPGTGGNTGFSGQLAMTGAGRHSVCLYAINVGPGSNTLMGCRNVDLPGPAGSLDVVTSTAQGSLTIAGWAADPDAPNGAENVHLYVTGPGGTAFGTSRTGGYRPDVRSAIPWVGPNSGFTGSIPAASAGDNQVCAYAINVNPPNTNPMIGCRTVTVRDAFGSLDSVTGGTGQIRVAGWALNPNQPSGTVELHVYDYAPSGAVRGTPGVMANQNRPDVAAAYAGYGSAHGFSGTVPSTEKGNHRVCVYAITTDGGYGNPQLGCRDVTVS